MPEEVPDATAEKLSDLSKFGRIVLIAFFVFLAWIHSYFFGILGVGFLGAWLFPSANKPPLVELALLISLIGASVTLRFCLRGIWLEGSTRET